MSNTIDRGPRHSLPPEVGVKLAQLEPMLASADWMRVREAIAPHVEDQAGLSPEIALLYALALHEVGSDGKVDPSALAIDAMAALLGVPERSPIAVLLAKRLVRRAHPTLSRPIERPRWPMMLLVGVLALVAGLALGWLFSRSLH